MRPMHYILDENRKPVPIPWGDTSRRWGRFLDDITARRVAWDEGPGWELSTACVGIDMSYGAAPEPMIFESQLTRLSDDEKFQVGTYPSWELAAAGHAILLNDLRQGENAHRN